jgi:hypothetical protein
MTVDYLGITRSTQKSAIGALGIRQGSKAETGGIDLYRPS